ncbi:Aldedh-domain-containing protein [Venturia nashicola]|uniref:aldehyde dehydrogenase (NAD(+)) n=1 Tax=Venturia nashicola TaxID=86259 RepID=A0A4Z1PDM1_9PEZI|nr:Aldedh-domain-containing protein [Venturia nashicola]
MEAFPGDLELEDGLPQLIIIAIVGLASVYVFARLFTDTESAVDYTIPEPEQLHPDWKGEVLDEPSLNISGSSAIQCYAPATGQLLGLVNPATPDGIDRAIRRAQEAQKSWATTNFSERRRVLQTLLKFVLENQEPIARAACLDSGKTRVDASFGEILVTVEKLKWTIKHGSRALKPEKRPTNLLMMYKSNEVKWEPLGIVSALVSWNYPFHNLLGPTISAIFAGNGIIVKGSEQTAWSSQYFTSIARGALSACGHDENLIQSVICWPSVAPYLTSHPAISHLTFIGSQEIAYKVATSAAKSLTECCLELGGKDAAILLDDIKDIDRVVATIIRGTFQSAGQNCIGIERVICLPKIYDKVIPLLQPIVESLRPGSALNSKSGAPVVDVGASVSSAGFSKVENLIADAVKQGARLLVGGKQFHHPDYPKGHYFSPTLLVDVIPSMKIASTELFAPVCLLMRASSISDAIAIANGTEYGLGSSVFGSSSEDLERVTRELKAGMVAVNDFAAYYAVQLPFGGVKGSGYGRFAGEEGLRSLSAQKSIIRDRFPGLIKTAIPGPLQLPLANEQRAWDMCKGIVEFGYGETLSRQIGGIRKLIGI